MARMTHAQVVEAVESALAEFGAARSELEQLQALQDKELSEVRARHEESFASREKALNSARERLVKLWERYGEELCGPDGGKMATFRNGTLSERNGPPAVVLGERRVVLLYLRARSAVRRFTKKPEPEISKNLLKSDPSFVDKAPDDIMHFERTRTLYIRPTASDVETAQKLGTVTVKLTDELS